MANASGSRLRDRLGGSLLLKILAALLINLTIASAVMSLAASRLTRSALTEQAQETARSQLRILEDAYAERDRNLADRVRKLAAAVGTEGLTVPEKRNELIARLSVAAGDLRVDLLQAVNRQGDALVGQRDGAVLQVAQPALRDGDLPWRTSGLLATTDGAWLQAAVAPIGAGPHSLVGGYRFGDAFAYELRRRIGDLDDVILVAGDEVAGSTLPHQRGLPAPGRPGSRAIVRLGGVETYVQYLPVGRGSDGAGALGVALSDPFGLLDRSLARSRLLATAILSVIALALGWLLFRALTRPLVGLAHTAEKIAAGDLQASFQTSGRDEVGRLADALQRMTSALKAQSARLQESAKRTVAAQDEERHRLARDLHDGAQQRLVTLSLMLRLARSRLETGRDPELEAMLVNAATELSRALDELRELARGIHPAILTEAGLGAALESLAERSPVATTVTSAPPERLPPAVEATAYFVVSEALVNAAKHAHASAVTVSVARTGTCVRVEVADDGKGGADPTRGSGLTGLWDRASAVGGWLTIESPPGGGTRIAAEIPCE